jgi:hypothetical protein
MATRAEVADKAKAARVDRAWRKKVEKEEFDRIFQYVESAPSLQYVRFLAEDHGVAKLQAIKREAYKRRGIFGQQAYSVKVIDGWYALDVCCTAGK